MKFKKWSDDKWLSKNGSILPYDKLEHLLLGVMGMLIGIYWFDFSLLASFIILEVLGVGWEIKDGLVPYNKKGDIEGFSWKDLIADNVGFLPGFLINVLLPN